MTQNRAHKLAARAAAATADVRRPEVIYQTDHRALFVGRGVYNFADGPLRIAGGHRWFVAQETQDVVREAESKGWRVITTESLPKAGLSMKDLNGPTLLVLNVNSAEAYGSLDPLTIELIKGEHSSVNVLVVFHFEAEVLTGPAKRRGMTIRMVPPIEVAEPREWVMLRIAVARRYADMLRAGGDECDSLTAVAHDVEWLGPSIEASSLMAQALRQAAAAVKRGEDAQAVWTPHQEFLGSHLFQMLIAGKQSGETAQALIQAAETLEADMRIGLI